MSQEKSKRWQNYVSMPNAYDKLCQKLVPQYDFLQNEVLNILDFNP